MFPDFQSAEGIAADGWGGQSRTGYTTTGKTAYRRSPHTTLARLIALYFPLPLSASPPRSLLLSLSQRFAPSPAMPARAGSVIEW